MVVDGKQLQLAEAVEVAWSEVSSSITLVINPWVNVGSRSL